MSRNPGNASVAATMARSVSARPPFGTVPITDPSTGFVTSMVPPPSAPTHSPPIRFACFIQSLNAIVYPFVKVNTVTCSYVSPGRSVPSGNPAWLGASGQSCGSSATPAWAR